MTDRDDPQAAPADDREIDPEVPETDALEQRAEVARDGAAGAGGAELPADPDLEADPADVAEQSRTVDPGDDEYR